MDNEDFMTIKRLILVVLTMFAIGLIVLDLLGSWNQPQIQSRLELYQTNLLLRITELRSDDPNLLSVTKAIAGNNAIDSALKNYQEFRDLAQKNFDKTQRLLESEDDADEVKSLKTTQQTLAQLMTDLDVNIGILQTQERGIEQALQTWNGAIDRSVNQSLSKQTAKTLEVLDSLWKQPPQLLPDAELVLRKNLEGWFRDRALYQLYTLQQRQDALQALAIETQQAAEQAFQSLAIVTAVPVVGCLIGVGLLLFLIGQWVVQRKQAWLASETMKTWSTPWDAEIVWQVLTFGFLLVGQIVLPLLFGLLRGTNLITPAMSGQGRAVLLLLNYLLLAIAGLSVLYISIKPFLPLPEGWFRIDWKGSWFFWGLGGYFAALPLVILVSQINAKIWQGQGGSNPVLSIALQEKNGTAIVILFLMAAVAAPIFEEILFRGFLLASLTRYVPAWGAIALSALIFGIVHLSLSEVLPLTVLGMVLGFVYVRSRNLLASMLLHGLWNSGTLLSLLVLGSGQN